MSNSPTTPKLLRDPEVDARPRRRTFTGEYKARVIAECDSATEAGAIGAILRREGLYSSHLTEWRSRRARGGESALAPAKTGRPAKPVAVAENDKELARVLRDNAVLREKLRRADLIIDAQKKLSEVLELLRSPPKPNGRDE